MGAVGRSEVPVLHNHAVADKIYAGTPPTLSAGRHVSEPHSPDTGTNDASLDIG